MVCCGFEERLLFRGVHLIPRAVGHADAGIAFQLTAMAHMEVPVQTVERTGGGPGFVLSTVMATAAIGAHFFDVLCAAHVWLRAYNASICKLAHSTCVRDFHPLQGIDVNAQIPSVNRIGMNACEQGEIACDHQTLDVMSVGVFERLVNRMREAFHLGFSCPKPRWERLLVVEEIQGFVSRHLRPIHASHVLSPTQYLTNESFGLRDVHPLRIITPGLLNRLNDFIRRNQFDIHQETQS